jgi:pyruvate, water dikinase
MPYGNLAQGCRLGRRQERQSRRNHQPPQHPGSRGFAITTKAFHDFFEYNDLKEEIIKQKNLLYVNEIDQLNSLSEETLELVRHKPLPPELEEAILSACQTLWGDDQTVLLAMRSSAVGEDGDISYAGQYLTLLGLTRAESAMPTNLSSPASFRPAPFPTATPRASTTRTWPWPWPASKWSIPVASGVLYTRHPYDITNEHILINAVWGLGPYAVDGVVSPDAYTVSKDDTPDSLKKRSQPSRCNWSSTRQGGVEERPVPAERQSAPCLTDDQIRILAGYGAALERHYKCPQDVEWALDRTAP